MPKELWNPELGVGRARGWQKASALTLHDWEKGKGPGVVSQPGGASRSESKPFVTGSAVVKGRARAGSGSRKPSSGLGVSLSTKAFLTFA